MKFLGDEIQFKSQRSVYWIEERGDKNHTERLITGEEEKSLKEHSAKRIRIINADELIFYFIREITNIWKEGGILGYYLYSFTWKHEEDKVQK